MTSPVIRIRLNARDCNTEFHTQQPGIMSKFGIILSSIYLLIGLGCIAFALLLGGDFKSRFVFLQAPIALQIALIDAIGLGHHLNEMSWVQAYATLFIPTLALFYFIGSILGKLAFSISQTQK